MVCSAFVKNVYYELCGLKLPLYTHNYLGGSGDEKGVCSPISEQSQLECSPNPDNNQLIGQKYGLIAYGHRDNNNQLLMEVYGSRSGNYVSTVTNPTLENIIPRLKVGDIVTVTGHVMLVYDIETNQNDEVIGATIIHCSQRVRDFLRNPLRLLLHRCCSR